MLFFLRGNYRYSVQDQFTVLQISNLTRQFKEIAPSGFISCKEFVDCLQRMAAISICLVLDPFETGFINWHRFLMAAARILPVPNVEQLKALKHALTSCPSFSDGKISREDFMAVPLWFEDSPHSDINPAATTSTAQITTTPSAPTTSTTTAMTMMAPDGIAISIAPLSGVGLGGMGLGGNSSLLKFNRPAKLKNALFYLFASEPADPTATNVPDNVNTSTSTPANAPGTPAVSQTRTQHEVIPEETNEGLEGEVAGVEVAGVSGVPACLAATDANAAAVPTDGAPPAIPPAPTQVPTPTTAPAPAPTTGDGTTMSEDILGSASAGGAVAGNGVDGVDAAISLSTASPSSSGQPSKPATAPAAPALCFDVYRFLFCCCLDDNPKAGLERAFIVAGTERADMGVTVAQLYQILHHWINVAGATYRLGGEETVEDPFPMDLLVKILTSAGLPVVDETTSDPTASMAPTITTIPNTSTPFITYQAFATACEAYGLPWQRYSSYKLEVSINPH
ncbi:Sperm flagellar protein 2 [Quaeritorhiza haematococci]|nr:Sperm flagellar protein 2 [Quaeritorhiza haematococci]